MGSTANHLAEHLEDLGIGVRGGTDQWGIYLAHEPEIPADVITLYDTGGLEPDTDELDLLPTIQVRVRSLDYLAGFAKLEAIRNALIVPATIVVAGTTYIGLEADSDAAHIGRDENDRDLFVANFRTRKDRS